MKKTVKVYKVTVKEALIASQETGVGYSLRPWNGDDQNYRGWDDGGKNYILPDGFEIGKDAVGMPHFYDESGQHHDLISVKGQPAIAKEKGYVFLKKEAVIET